MLVLTCRVGSHRLALRISQIREVIPRIPLQSLASAPPWICGVLVYHGEIVPVIDLHRLFGEGGCPAHLSSRIILVPLEARGHHRLVGLLAAQVADLREIDPGEQLEAHLTLPGQPDLGPVLVEGEGILHLVELDRLLPESMQRPLMALAAEEGR